MWYKYLRIITEKILRHHFWRMCGFVKHLNNRNKTRKMTIKMKATVIVFQKNAFL